MDGIRGYANRFPPDAVAMPARVSLRWPDADSAMHRHWAAAGLVTETQRCFRPLVGLATRPVGASVRRARAADLDVVAAPGGGSRVLTPFAVDAPAEPSGGVRTSTRPVFVVERDGEVLGYATCQVGPTADVAPGRRRTPGRTVHLTAVELRPDAYGAGALLVAGLAADLGRRGVTGCSVDVVPGDLVARRFWAAQGFRPVWRNYVAAA